jgi:hypothetical protein
MVSTDHLSRVRAVAKIDHLLRCCASLRERGHQIENQSRRLELLRAEAHTSQVSGYPIDLLADEISELEKHISVLNVVDFPSRPEERASL